MWLATFEYSKYFNIVTRMWLVLFDLLYCKCFIAIGFATVHLNIAYITAMWMQQCECSNVNVQHRIAICIWIMWIAIVAAMWMDATSTCLYL